LTLVVLTSSYKNNSKIVTKIIIQLLILLSLFDIIWIFFFSSAWSKATEEDRDVSKDVITYWDSLSFIHGLVYFLAFVELILKIIIAVYLSMDYFGKYKDKGFKDLLTLSYDKININKDNSDDVNENENNNISNDVEEAAEELANFSEDKFNNEYEQEGNNN